MNKLIFIFRDLMLTFKNIFRYYQKFKSIPIVYPLSVVIKNMKNEQLNDNLVVERINLLIEYATKHVPYYIKNKQMYKKINDISELSDIPVLLKSTFKEQNNDFISPECNRWNSFKFRTSGSTGTPLRGAISNNDLQKRFKIFLFALKEEGIDYSRPLARFPGSEFSKKGKIYRTDFLHKHYLFSIYDLSKEKISHYYTALHDKKIEIIEGYPSTIYSLVKLLREAKLTLPYVKHVLTTAEKLLDYQKEEIESYFNVKIFDFYGSSEGSVFMFSGKNELYYNSNVIGYLECVDENYKPVQSGKSGRMLITSFSSKFTPLIRYDIGDYATIVENDNGEIKVSEILGRQEEIFITPSGHMFGRFSLVLKYLPNSVLESQLELIQKSNKAKLFYVSNERINHNEFIIFEKKLNELLNLKFDLEYVQVNTLDKSKRGKLAAVKIVES